MRSLARICPMYRGLRLPSEMSGVEERLSLAVGCVSTVPTFHLRLVFLLFSLQARIMGFLRDTLTGPC